MKRLDRWRAAAAAIVALGVLLRVARWLAHRSLWGDEIALAQNLVDRSFAGLLHPLTLHQGAPVGFLWLEKAFVLVLGPSELALRFVPLLAGVGALLLLRRVARRLLAPGAALLALLVLAVAEPHVRYSCETKQYSTEVFVALLLLDRTVALLVRPATARRRRLLAASGLLGLLLAHSAVFACGGSIVSLAIAAARRRDRRELVPIGATAASWAVLFALSYFAFLRPLLADDPLNYYWERLDAYPPGPPWSLDSLRWHALAAVAVFNDPAGLPAWYVALPVCLLGAVSLVRRKPAFATALLLPIVLVLAAAELHRFPFATSFDPTLQDGESPRPGRLDLFATPAIYLALACGVGELATLRFDRFRLLPLAASAALLASPLAHACRNLVATPRIQEVAPVVSALSDRIEDADLLFVRNRSALHYRFYAERDGLDHPFEEFGAETADEIRAFKTTLRALPPVQRLWIVYFDLLYEEPDRAERQVGALLDRAAVRLDSIVEHRAHAWLYRTRAASESPARER